MKTVVFNTHTGKISRVVIGPASMAWLQHGDQEDFLIAGRGDEVDDMTHYVDVATEELRPRVPHDTRHTVDGLSIVLLSLLPGTQVYVMGKVLVADGGHDEIEVDVPGTYRLELRHPHCLDESLEVTLG